MRTPLLAVSLLLTAAVPPAAPAAAATSATAAPAQQRRQGGGETYNLARETTITATVVGIQTDEPAPGTTVAFLAVTVKGEELRIFLPPPDWMEKQSFAFPAGATATITGVTGYRLNGDAMMPRAITIGGKTLTLRDAAGKPVWETGKGRQ